MPTFFKYDVEDLKELLDACERNSVKDINKFISKHNYYTCSCCHKEERYVDSPVVVDELWQEILFRLGIEDNNEIKVGEAYFLPNNPEHKSAMRFYKTFKQINKVTPDGEYVMLCRDCMEKALGRPLYKEDLKRCEMTDNIIDKFKSKK